MSPPSQSIVIAVDGTAASGKGTLAKRLAQHFGFAHLDSGALYRLTALAVLEAKGEPLGIVVQWLRMVASSLLWSGARCTMTTYATPRSGASAPKKCWSASMPPADAPIPQTGIRGAGELGAAIAYLAGVDCRRLDVERHAHEDGRAAAGCRLQVECPADEQRALAHAHESESRAAGF